MQKIIKFFTLIFDLLRGLLLLCFALSVVLCFLLVPCALINYFAKPVWPINMAARYGNIPAIKTLIVLGSDINKHDKEDNRPLTQAYDNNRYEAFKFLIKKGANFNIPDKHGRNLFMAALADKKTNFVKAMVDAGADVNTKSSNNSNPLSLAISTHNTELAKYLLDKGANIKEKDSFNQTPLQNALWHNEIEIAKILIEKGADINEISIFNVLSANKIELLKLLIEKGADVNQKDKNNRTPIFYTHAKDQIEILKLLIEKGAKVDIQAPFTYDHTNGTPLDYAIRSRDNEEILCLLIENGATTQAPISGGETLLTFAISNKYINLIKLLAEQKVNFSQTNAYKVSPLQKALYTNDPEIINLVIANVSNINEKVNNKSILSFAFSNSMSIDIIQLLIEKGADINTDTSSRKGNSLLMSAIELGRPLDYDAPDYIKNEINRSREIAKLLIKNKAKLNTKNQQGNTALKLAQIYHDDEMVKLLRQAGAKE